MITLLSTWTFGLALGLVALGVFVSYRLFSFSDITTDGSFTLGVVVTAVLLTAGIDPAGAAAGACTGMLHAFLRIEPLLSGILMTTALASVKLVVLGRSNVPLAGATTLFDRAEGLVVPVLRRLGVAAPVAVLQQASTAVLDDTVVGMLEGFVEKGFVEKGFVDGQTVSGRRYNAEGDLAQANAIAREMAHNPAESNSRRFMELARASCRRQGIDLLEAAVENSSGVIEAIQSTISRGAEVIFVPGDTTVSSVIDSIVATAGKAGIPVFTVVPGRPDRGTLFDVGFDFREVGLVAGRLAGDLLRGTDPAAVPIGETAKLIPPRLTVNLTAPGVDAARRRFPAELLAQARVVIGPAGRQERRDAVLAGPFDEAE